MLYSSFKPPAVDYFRWGIRYCMVNYDMLQSTHIWSPCTHMYFRCGDSTS